MEFVILLMASIILALLIEGVLDRRKLKQERLNELNKRLTQRKG